MKTHTFSTTHFANLMLGAFEKLGIPAHLALKGTGLSTQQLNSDKVVPFERIYLIFLNGLIYTKRQPDELAFLCGLNTNINAYGSLGLAAMSEARLGNALELFMNYLPVYMPGLAIEKKHLNEQVSLTLKKSAQLDDLILELIDCALIGSSLAILKMFTGESYKRYAKRVEVDLPFEKKTFISNNPELKNFKFNFQTKVSQLRFHRQVLDFKLPMANPKMVRQIIQNQPLNSTTKNLGTAVKDWINKSLHTPPSISQACETFAMSERSFNRKLKEEGYSYRQLLLEARMLKAEHELKTSNKKISSIAKEVGYQDIASFNRAFKKFFNTKPSNLKK